MKQTRKMNEIDLTFKMLFGKKIKIFNKFFNNILNFKELKI